MFDTTSPKFLGQFFITCANLLGLEAPKHENKFVKIGLHAVENLTRNIAFSDLNFTEKLCPSKSFKGALGLTLATALDDIAITYDLYQDHHLARFGSAAYIGYMLGRNETIQSSFMKSIPYSNVMTPIIIGGALASLSYLLGVGDTINIMRSNTEGCVKYTDSIYDLSGGNVNLNADTRVGALTGCIVNGSRQFLGDFELGGPASLASSVISITMVNLLVSNKSEAELKLRLTEIFCEKLAKLKSGDIARLDPRARDILDNLAERIKQACSSIEKHASNVGVKYGYQHFLTSTKLKINDNEYHSDLGFSVYVTSMLFNNATPDSINEKVAESLGAKRKDYSFNAAANTGDIESMQKILCSSLDNKQSQSGVDTVVKCFKKLGGIILPVLFNSMLIGMMTNPKASFYDFSGTHKKAYTALGYAEFASALFIDIEGVAAVQELQYLITALDELNQESSGDSNICWVEAN
jgi:hypothetical protein